MDCLPALVHREGSTVVDSTVVMKAEDEATADSNLVKSLLALREGPLSVGNVTTKVVELHLQGRRGTAPPPSCFHQL